MIRIVTALLFLLWIPFGVEAQSPDSTRADSINVFESVARILDNRDASQQTSAAASELLAGLSRDPLDANRASVAELTTIPDLSPALANRIVQYRSQRGPFQSLSDLTGVDGMDDAHLRSVRPYLTVSRPESGSNDSTPYSPLPSFDQLRSGLEINLLQRITRDLELGRGYSADSSETAFQGAPGRLTTRLQVSADRHLQMALTLDKDPGEALRWAPEVDTYGFDHVAGNVTLRDWGRLETLVLGHFAVQYGQGAALWQGLSFGKGRDPVSPLVRSGRGIVPFQSTSENRFFRGMAASVAVSPSISLSTFVSRRRRDATLDSTASPIAARTLSSGGRHRTQSELRRKGTFGTKTVGGALKYRSRHIRVGMVGHRTWFDRPLQPANKPYRRFDVSGNQSEMLSVFGHAYLDPYTVFGEVARSKSGTYGAVAGATFDHKGGIEAVLLARHFPPSFAGLYNSAVGESGSTQNEQGIYTGLRVQLSERWTVGAYVDQYQFPWAQYTVLRPSRGLDTRLIISYDPRPWLSSYVQVRAEREEQGADVSGPAGRTLAGVQTEYRQSARWSLKYRFSDAWITRTRLQGSRFRRRDQPWSVGVLLSQGVRVKPTRDLRFDARIAFFDTDGYASRIYAYEHDLLYSFSVPVLYGRGRRSYVLLQYEPVPSLTLEAKYGITWYPHRTTTGSGLNTVESNRSRAVRVQVRWQY